ncbi:hypothetical protein D1AOALGA4SA_2637 [Olavius algarvensis Delta 1 endosymbiont]|nr:hypothetical protein D1AOALGA4SA_2637 [Olavius algarvensis Delta 1 endosymbiont]
MALLFGKCGRIYEPKTGTQLRTSHKMIKVSEESAFRMDSRMYFTFDLNQ